MHTFFCFLGGLGKTGRIQCIRGWESENAVSICVEQQKQFCLVFNVRSTFLLSSYTLLNESYTTKQSLISDKKYISFIGLSALFLYCIKIVLIHIGNVSKLLAG